MATQTLEKAQELRREQIEDNRALGVVEYRSGEKQSDEIYEVVEGYKHLPGGIRLGPGQRFRPTERQLSNGSLRGKARPLTRSEYESVRRDERRAVSRGAEIGLRQFKMADGTRSFASDNGLTEDDFRGLEPEGANEQFTRAQVEEMVEAKSAGSADA